MPLYLTISLVPTLIISDMIKRSRINYIRKISNKVGIKDTAIITFEFKGGTEL